MTGHTRWEHILRARRLTPERYELVMRALRALVDECLVDDEFGYVCAHCPRYSKDREHPVHEKDCIVPEVEELLKELEREEAEAQQRREQLKETTPSDGEPHPPSPAAPSPR